MTQASVDETNGNTTAATGLGGLWIGPSVLALAFLALLCWTWRRWADPLIDFGRELYVPWQLSEGAILYRDVAYFNGPLAPQFNSWMFQWAGVSWTTLIWTNVVLAALLVSCLYRLVQRSCGPLAATLSGLVLLCGFAFSHLLNDGNYNYITPYSFDATYGLFLSLVMLLVLTSRYALRSANLLLGGVLLGSVFLTKGEVFLAAAAAAVGGLVFQALVARPTRRSIVGGAAVFLLGASALPAAFAVCLSRQMPWSEALLGVSGTWRWILASQVTELYRPMSGFDRPTVHLSAMFLSLVATGLILSIFTLYDYQQHRAAHRRSIWFLLALLLGGVALLRRRGFPILLEGESLLLVALAMVIGYTRAAWQHRDKRPVFQQFASLALFALFGLGLLAKIVLAPRITHYGFVLAMPATILAVATLVRFAPELFCRRWQGGDFFRRGAIAVIAADILGCVLMSSANVPHKNLPLGEQGDRMYTYDAQHNPAGPALALLLEELAREPAATTLAVFPEGVMMNYLARMPNPTGFTNAMPPELRMYGEAQYVAALRRTRPDLIVLIDKEMSEYGVGPFGSRDFGAPILAWIRKHYRIRRTIGAKPLVGEGFGIEILEPKSEVLPPDTQPTR